MHNIEIPDIKVKIDYPSSLNEMTGKQYIAFIELYLLLVEKHISYSDFKVRVFMMLTDTKWTFKYRKWLNNEQRMRINENMFRLSETIESFVTKETIEGVENKVIDLFCIKNLIPKIGKYYGPDDALTNISFCEFRTWFLYYQKFCEEQKEDDLNNMIAVLYRPQIKFWKLKQIFSQKEIAKREKFTAKTNTQLLNVRAKQIGKYPYPIRYGIFLFFRACMTYLSTGKPNINGNYIDLSILYKKEDVSTNNSIGWIGLLYELAESRVFGNIEETDNQNLYDILVRLYQLSINYEKIKNHGSSKKI